MPPLTMEDQFEKATAARDIPGVVLLAGSNDGKFKYEKAIGPKNPAGDPIDLNTTFILASCTKLMTSIAAMQCVERGLITLDEDLSLILTEFKEIEIITGFKEGSDEPILKKAENKISLRQLLTHTSGLGYDIFQPALVRWRKFRNEPFTRGQPILHRITTPLLFEPGSSHQYSTSLDWAGILISRLTHMSLEEYMQKNIWDPLDIKKMTFHQEKKPDVEKNLVKMSARGPMMSAPSREQKKVEWTDELLYDVPNEWEYGGGGCVGSAVDYMKILNSIGGNDGKLLKLETIDRMFKPQLSQEAVKAYEQFQAQYKDAFSSHKDDIKIDHGLGGMLVMDDEDTGRKKGTMSWSGLPNLLWTIDREAGLNLFYASNVVPFGDFKSGELQRVFEKEMYSRYAKFSGGLN